MAKATMQDIIQAMRTAGYNYYGVRTGQVKNVGDILDPSHDWDFERDCQSDDYLPGTCATGIAAHYLDEDEDLIASIEKAITTNHMYGGDGQYIIGGNAMEYGSDSQEMVIANAEVIYVIK